MITEALVLIDLIIFLKLTDKERSALTGGSVLYNVGEH